MTDFPGHSRLAHEKVTPDKQWTAADQAGGQLRHLVELGVVVGLIGIILGDSYLFCDILVKSFILGIVQRYNQLLEDNR